VPLDQFTRTDGTSYLGSANNNLIDQQPWISAALAARPERGHSPYAVSVSSDPHQVRRQELEAGRAGLATPDADGHWMNAVDGNPGGRKAFVVGPWDTSYALGTWGVDPATRTAWAVVDHEGREAAGGSGGRNRAAGCGIL